MQRDKPVNRGAGDSFLEGAEVRLETWLGWSRVWCVRDGGYELSLQGQLREESCPSPHHTR